MQRDRVVVEARAKADLIRDVAPDLARQIDRWIAEFLSGQRASLSIDVQIDMRLEKFDGDLAPGAAPVETICSTETL